MNKTAFRLFSLAVILAFLFSFIPQNSQRVVAAVPTDLFISEYIEGSSNNKAIEIYNGTGSVVDLAAGVYNIQMFFNGSPSVGTTVNLVGLVAVGDVFVLAQSSANATILAQADQTSSASWFNGDDAIVLRKGTTIIDVIGQIGSDPGTEWGSGLISTADNTLRRVNTICTGDPNGSDAFEPSTEWEGFATDTFGGLGSHTANCNAPDAAPKVTSSYPTDGATDVLLTSNVTINFSEPVNVSGNWFQLACGTSGTRTVADTAVSSDSTTFTIDPNADFANSETCTLTVYSAQVSDLDTNDPDDLMKTDYVTSFTVIGPDNAPAVASTIPADGATNVPLNQNITVNFTEPVNVTDPWFALTCATSGAHPAAVTGGPTSFTLNPATDFVYGESCTLVIDNTKVTDKDSNDPPDLMAFTFTAGFATEPDPCTLPFTPIYNIQGSGLSAAFTGNVSTKGVVVGDFEGSASSSGFYLQDLSGDGNPATSDGIFVYTGSSNMVSVGQVVRVTGYARERFNQTAINGSNNNTAAVPAANIVQCGTGSVAPVDVTLPFADANAPEKYEGMLVKFPQPLVISEYFNYDRFGEMVLALPLDGESRPFTGTAINEPGAAANARTLANSLSRITLDDAQSAQNPSVLRHPNGNPFSLTNLFRGGDTVQNAIGVLGYDFSLYRIVPTGPADYTAVNPRPAAPEPVGGRLRVAAMNTLNYFVTADYPTGNPLDNKCGPLNSVECRGWDSDQANEFTRQRDKLLAALAGLDAAVIGLNELENTTGVEPLADIVAGLPGYTYINTGTIGTDAIKVGLIYRPAEVTPIGDFKLLTSAVDPRFIDTKSRPSLAQTFEENASGARFTVVVNHFKSKGDSGLASTSTTPPGICVDADPSNDILDCDQGDGQGYWNYTRSQAAQALVDWLATDPTGSGDPDFIIMGDLNSYAMEDSITAIKAGSDDMADTADDYTNLIAKFQGKYAYSYGFDGQFGYLDHALANASMVSQVTGVADWHINADEPDVLDYDTTFKSAAQDALYEPNQYRTSDHDAVVVGLNLTNLPPTVAVSQKYYSTPVNTPVLVSAAGVDPEGKDLTYAWDLDIDGSFETSGQIVSFLEAKTGMYTIKVQVTDIGGKTATDTAIVAVFNPAGPFTTGGGWFRGDNNSKVNLEYDIKYLPQQMIPSGSLSFVIPTTKKLLSSTSFDWLVVSGDQAWFMGTGTINGVDEARFLVEVKDVARPDQFGIKIWDGSSVIYDTIGLQDLKGGSIQIHK